MKRVLVLALLCVFGLGVATFAGPLSGFWNTDLTFHITGANITLPGFTSLLGVNYSIGGWTFGSTSTFLNVGFVDQNFTAVGALGAFTIGSYIDFDALGQTFTQWLTGVKVSIAGVTLFGFFDVENWVWNPCAHNASCGGDGAWQTCSGTASSGFLLGAEGSAGDVTFAGEAYFNLWQGILGAYTFDDIVPGFSVPAYDFDPLHGCYNYIPVASDAFLIQTCGTCACWSGFTGQVTFPLGCIDKVSLYAYFNATRGFDMFRIWFEDIKFAGIDWMWIDDVRIDFRPSMYTDNVCGVVQTYPEKLFSRLDIDIKIPGICFTPYFEFNKPGSQSGFKLDYLELYALTLDYTWNGVTFSLAELFNTTDYYLTWAGKPISVYAAGLATWDDCDPCVSPYNELIKIVVDADACCGGAFGFAVYNWFMAGDPAAGLFGWKETDVHFSLGIGSNFGLTLDLMVVDGVGFETFGVGFDVSW
jgi:hypothetical protein